MRPHSAIHSVPPLEIEGLGDSYESPRSRRSTNRPATVGKTARSSVNAAAGLTGQLSQKSSLDRRAVVSFDSYQKDDLKELIAQSTASWLLSEGFRFNVLPLNGVVTSLKLSQDSHLAILIPKNGSTKNLEYRLLHQIIRDLTVGIFAFNQMPSFSFEPNHDLTSTCQLPLAYQNTTLGKLLISTDYLLKSLWHGTTVPEKLRPALTDRWRSFVKDKNLVADFTTAGQSYVTQDIKYQGLYNSLNKIDPSNIVADMEHKLFNKFTDDIRCSINFHVTSVRASTSSNVVAFESKFDIESQIVVPEEKIDSSLQQKLRRRLRSQMEAISNGMLVEDESRKKLELLKIVAFLTPLLVALRKRMMRIPDIDSMLSLLSTENTSTEAKIPPFAFGEDKERPCLTFSGPGLAHAHGGITFDLETATVEALGDDEQCQKILEESFEHVRNLFGGDQQVLYTLPVANIDGKEYQVLCIPLKIYYAASPPQPEWLHAIYQELASLRPKELPLTDLAVTEQFRGIFGSKKAFANQGKEDQLKMSAQRGLIAPFITLMRKVNINALFSPDMSGMTLVHYAAMHNRPTILGLLLNQRQSVNIRRRSPKVKSEKHSDDNKQGRTSEEKTGLSPLHYAARTGSVECCTLLIACKASLILSDDSGWSAIHHAAYCGHVSILRVLLRKQSNLLELRTTGNDECTPYLVAASGGFVECVKFLLQCGANFEATDIYGDTAVHKATLNFHTKVLEYFINRLENGVNCLPVWNILVGMLKSERLNHQDAALRSLEMLLYRNSLHWRSLFEADAIAPLVSLLDCQHVVEEASNILTDDDIPICSLACSVICLMSENDEIRQEVSSSGAIKSLIQLLSPGGDETTPRNRELQSRSSVVLSDLANIDGNPAVISKEGGIKPLVHLLDTEVADVVLNALDTLRSVCQDGKMFEIQKEIIDCGAVNVLVELLWIKDESVPSAAAAAIAEICRYNQENQETFMHADILQPLVKMLRGRNFKAKVKAANVIESICHCNAKVQEQAEKEAVAEALCSMFLALSDPVKEKAALALWELAGDNPEQQRRVAKKIGFRQIKDMLNSKSEILQLVGCRSVAAIAYMSSSGQKDLANYNDMIPNLIRLLRLETTARPVLVALICALSNLCIGVALVNNQHVQEIIADNGAIQLLIQRIWECTHDEILQVELLHCLACTVVRCRKNESFLNQHDFFGFEILLELMNSFNQSVRLRAIQTLTIFSYNRPIQQKRILQLGGVSIQLIEDLLSFPDDKIRARAAFQMVVLCKVIIDADFEAVSAKGILILAELLSHDDENVLRIAAQCIASLAHTRAGIVDGFVTIGAVGRLLKLITCSDDSVRTAASQALGYLTFNRVASRELISACRAVEGLYEVLVMNLGEDGRISDEFQAEYKRQCTIGLPIAKEWPRNRSKELDTM